METLLAVAVLTLASCTSDQDPGPSEPSAQSNASPAPEGGTPDQPVTIEATTLLMEWVPAPGVVENTVTTNGTWFLTVEASGSAYRLDGPDQAFGTGEDGTRITNALLDTDWAVVVRQDQGRKKPARAEVTDLAQGEQFTIDQDSDVPTISGGTWALGGDTLAYATLGQRAATAWPPWTSATRETSVAWCAEAKHGFNAAHVTDGRHRRARFRRLQPVVPHRGHRRGRAVRPLPRRPRVHRLGGRGARRRRGGLVGDPERGRHRHGRVLRPRGRGLLRPRPRHVGHARPVRGRGVLRPRPAAWRAIRPSCSAGTAARSLSSTRHLPASRSSKHRAATRRLGSSPPSRRVATSR